MLVAGPSELLHLVGFLTGAVLYGLLAVLVLRTRERPDGFSLLTAVLGLVWNLGELSTYVLRSQATLALSPWMSATAFTALGLLGTVVVHVAVGASAAATGGRLVQALTWTGASAAGVLHFVSAARGTGVPSRIGLLCVSLSLLVALPALAGGLRHAADRRRALWLGALAVFAASALHLGQFHVADDSWPIEMAGHHASILLAFALLYQDYRFALADLFLKHALTLLAAVLLVSGAYALLAPSLPLQEQTPPGVVGLLIGLWVATLLVFPVVRRLVVVFVDRAVLQRTNRDDFVTELGEAVQACDGVEQVLDRSAALLARALTASEVSWEETRETAASARSGLVLTTDEPRYLFRVGGLAGGRRLLSDDLIMIERAGSLVARRIDQLRITGERYERMLEEREMRTLATEAELRALRAQINPHFLFNALTTIGYLIQHAPERALQALLRLTSLLRSVLRPEGEFTTLGRECDLIRSYLEIERERFEDRLRVVIDVPDDLLDIVIPSLIVQPLVENAIKHGIAQSRDGGEVRLTATAGDLLRVQVRNTGQRLHLRRPEGSGLGLENIARRLRHYYSGEAGFRLATEPDGTTVAELHLPLDPADRPDAVGVVRKVAR